MRFVLFSILLFALSYFLLSLTLSISPWAFYRPDLFSVLLVYGLLRPKGRYQAVFLLIVLSFAHFGSGNPRLEWPPILILLATTGVYSLFFRRVYIESYLIEALHVGLILAIALSIESLYFGMWRWVRYAQVLVSVPAAFLLFLLFDVLFKRVEKRR